MQTTLPALASERQQQQQQQQQQQTSLHTESSWRGATHSAASPRLRLLKTPGHGARTSKQRSGRGATADSLLQTVNSRRRWGPAVRLRSCSNAQPGAGPAVQPLWHESGLKAAVVVGGGEEGWGSRRRPQACPGACSWLFRGCASPAATQERLCTSKGLPACNVLLHCVQKCYLSSRNVCGPLGCPLACTCYCTYWQ